MHTPSEEFVKFIAAQVYSGKLTGAVRGQFAVIMKRAFAQFINEQVTERLRSAMGEPGLPEGTTSEFDTTDGHQNGAVTPENANRVITPDELEAYYIVKAITCAVIDAERVVYRDTQSYFGILCDDNNRKPICRLHFNGKHKFIGILDVNKNEEKVSIDNPNEIYKQADKFRATAGSYVPERLLAYLSLKYPYPLIWYNAFINPLTRKKNKVPHSHRRNHVRYYKPNIPT